MDLEILYHLDWENHKSSFMKDSNIGMEFP